MAFAENGINAIYRLGIFAYVGIAAVVFMVIIREVRRYYRRRQEPLLRQLILLDKLNTELREANYRLQAQMQARLMTEREATLLRRLRATDNAANLEVALAELDRVVNDVTALIPPEVCPHIVVSEV